MVEENEVPYCGEYTASVVSSTCSGVNCSTETVVWDTWVSDEYKIKISQ